MSATLPGEIDLAAIRMATTGERRQLMELAIGCILRLGSRPVQLGDIEHYETARMVILACADAKGDDPARYADHRPNYARDRMRGAQGD